MNILVRRWDMQRFFNDDSTNSCQLSMEPNSSSVAFRKFVVQVSLWSVYCKCRGGSENDYLRLRAVKSDDLVTGEVVVMICFGFIYFDGGDGATSDS